jgi:hypothetical protein
MASHRLFCKLEQLEEVILFKDDYPYLSNIIDQFCDVVLDVAEDNFLTIIGENPILKRLFKRENATAKADKNNYENIENQEFKHFLNDILILDLENKKTKDIRDSYGILAINLNEDFLKNQNYQFGYSIGKSKTSLKKCWSELFSDKIIEPINSAIIIDNFLWGSISDYREENMDNIYPILKSIIPKNLKVPFHLTIVLQNKDGRLERKKVKPIINKMKKAIKKETNIDVELSIVTQTNTRVFHERVILTNYHYIYSHKGFICFKEKNIIKETNGTRNWVFKDIDNYINEIDKHKHQTYSRSVFELINSNKKEEDKDIDTIFYQGESVNPILSNFT